MTTSPGPAAGPTGAGGPVEAPRLTLYTRVGCHLCEPAHDVLVALAAESGVAWREVDVDAPPADQPDLPDAAALRAAYGDKVPAVTLDGELVAWWQVDGDVLRRALDARG